MLLPRRGRRTDQAPARDPDFYRLTNRDSQPYPCHSVSDFELDAFNSNGNSHLHLDDYRHAHTHRDHSADQFFHAVPAADVYVHSLSDPNQHSHLDRDENADFDAHRYANSVPDADADFYGNLYTHFHEYTPAAHANLHADRLCHADCFSNGYCFEHSVGSCCLIEYIIECTAEEKRSDY